MDGLMMLSSAGYMIIENNHKSEREFFRKLTPGTVFLVEEPLQSDPFIIVTNIVTDEITLISHRDVVKELNNLIIEKIGEISYERTQY